MTAPEISPELRRAFVIGMVFAAGPLRALECLDVLDDPSVTLDVASLLTAPAAVVDDLILDDLAAWAVQHTQTHLPNWTGLPPRPEDSGE